MKAICKITTIIALVFAMGTGSANDPKFRVVNKKEQKALVFQLDNRSDDTYIQIRDAAERTLYSEWIDKGVYAKRFDLEKLEAGTYAFQVSNSLKETTYELKIDRNAVEIIEKKKEMKPSFRRDGDKLFLNYLNFGKSPVTIKIMDGENRQLHKEILEDSLVIEKAFNFETALEGTYTLVLDHGSNTYYEEISVK